MVERLYSAVLIQTVKDWQRNPESRQDIREFLRSQMFVDITEILDLDPNVIRAKLEAGDLQEVSLRAAYRKGKNDELRDIPNRFPAGHSVGPISYR